jgi:hypothetical protein
MPLGLFYQEAAQELNHSARSRMNSICSTLTCLWLSSPLEFVIALRLDPVEQRLIQHSQCMGRRRNAPTTLDQSHLFLFEFGRVSRSCSFRHLRFPCVNLNTPQGIRFSEISSVHKCLDMLQGDMSEHEW